MRVTHQVTVPIAIGKYQYEVECVVLPMEAGHILLGRPWEYDRNVTHDGYTNRYSFEFKDKKITLIPMTPHEVYKDQLLLKQRDKEVPLKSINFCMKSSSVESGIPMSRNMLLFATNEARVSLTNHPPVYSSELSVILSASRYIGEDYSHKRFVPTYEDRDTRPRQPLNRTMITNHMPDYFTIAVTSNPLLLYEYDCVCAEKIARSQESESEVYEELMLVRNVLDPNYLQGPTIELMDDMSEEQDTDGFKQLGGEPPTFYPTNCVVIECLKSQGELIKAAARGEPPDRLRLLDNPTMELGDQVDGIVLDKQSGQREANLKMVSGVNKAQEDPGDQDITLVLHGSMKTTNANDDLLVKPRGKCVIIFKVTNLISLCADGPDLRTNPLQEREDDVILTSLNKDSNKPEDAELVAEESEDAELVVEALDGPRTRSRTKKVTQTIQGLMDQDGDQDGSWNKEVDQEEPGDRVKTMISIREEDRECG
jgi:hypothetical protein